MKMKYFRIFEIAYLVVAAISTFEVIQVWNVNRNRAYLFLFFAIVSLGMFFFRRYYRKKFSDRKNKSE